MNELSGFSFNRSFIEKLIMGLAPFLLGYFLYIYYPVIKPQVDINAFKNFAYAFSLFIILHLIWDKWIKRKFALMRIRVVDWTFYLLSIPFMSIVLMGSRGLLDHFYFLCILLSSFGFAIIDISFGIWVIKCLKIRMSKIQTYVVAWIGGSYLAAWFVYVFGILGFRTEFVRIGVLLFMLYLARKEFLDFLKGLIRPSPKPLKTGVLWVAAFLTIAMMLVYTGFNRVTTPVWHYDAMMIHMAAPKSYAVDGYISYLPAIRISCVTPMLQCHFTPVYILFGELGPKIYEAFCLVAVCLITYSLCITTGIKNKSYARLASLIILTTPLIAYMSGLCYQGIPGLALILTILSLAITMQRNRFKSEDLSKYFVLLGIFIGYLYLAHVRSYVVLLPTAWIIFSVFYAQITKMKIANLIKNSCLLILMSLIITSPILVRLWIQLGNPFFPLLSGIFGSSPEVLSIDEMTLLSKILSDVGCGKGFYDFLALPSRLLFNAAAFHGGGSLTIGAFLCAGIGIVFFGFIKKPFWIFLYFLSFFGFWFFKAQEMRYLLMLVPIFALAYAHGAKVLFGKYPFLLFLQGLAAIVLLLFHYPKLIQEKSNVVISTADQNTFLAGRVLGYRAIKQLEKFTTIDENVFQIGLEGSKFSYKNPGKMLGDYLGKYQYTKISGFEDDLSILKRVLDEWNVRFCVFNPNSFIKIDVPAFIKKYNNKGIEVIGIYDSVLVFALKEKSSPSLFNKKLISDIKFSDIPQGWQVAAGKITPSPEGLILHPGASVFMMEKITESNADSSFKLSAQMGLLEKGKDNNLVKLQVVWLTKDGWSATYSNGKPLIDVVSSTKEIKDKTTINLEAVHMMPNIANAHISVTNQGKEDIFLYNLRISEISIAK
jgi:hypothetical protein